MSGPRTAVVGGTLATDYGVFAADILIDGGRIAAVGRDPGIGRGADEVIDASGLVVLPGAIDPHAHFEDPGHTEREDFTTGTSAAAAGGITTVIEHPLTYPPVTTAELYRQKRDMAARKVVVRLRPVGRAVRAGAARDGRPVARGGVRLQGLHAVLGAGLSARERRRVRAGDAEREGARGARARARRVRRAPAGRPRAHAPGRAARPARPPRVAAGVRRGGGRAPGALPGAARRGAHPDRAHLDAGQRRSRRRRPPRRAAGDRRGVPAPPAARPGRSGAARPVRPLRARAAPARAGRGDVGARPRRGRSTASSPITARTRSRRRSPAGRTSSPRRSAAR